jgi:hypothetical protein
VAELHGNGFDFLLGGFALAATPGHGESAYQESQGKQNAERLFHKHPSLPY